MLSVVCNQLTFLSTAIEDKVSRRVATAAALSESNVIQQTFGVKYGYSSHPRK
jgi:hypothetical protein